MRLTIPLTVKYVAIGCLGIGALGSCRVCRRTRGSDKSKQCGFVGGLECRGFPTKRGSPHQEELRGIPGRCWSVLHDYVLEREGDRGRHENRLCVRFGFSSAGHRHRPRPAGSGQQQSLRPLHTQSRHQSWPVHVSGGTGKFTHIRLSANVTQLPGNNGEDWAWDGTYSFDPRD